MILALAIGSQTDKALLGQSSCPDPGLEFVVAMGPITEQERWEELPGLTPHLTIAAENRGPSRAASI